MFKKKGKPSPCVIIGGIRGIQLRNGFCIVVMRRTYCTYTSGVFILVFSKVLRNRFTTFLPFICLVLFGRRANARQINLSTFVELRDRLVAEILFLDARKSNLILFPRCFYFIYSLFIFFFYHYYYLLLNRPAVDNARVCVRKVFRYQYTGGGGKKSLEV